MTSCYEDCDIDLERYYGYFDDYNDEYCDNDGICDFNNNYGYGYYESNEDYGYDYRQKYYHDVSSSNQTYQRRHRSVRNYYNQTK